MKKLAVMILLAALFVCFGGCGQNGYTANTIQTETDSQVVLEQITLQIQGTDQRQEVKPESPRGYYNYYQDHDGYYYHVIYGKAKNNGGQPVAVENIKVQSVGENELFQGKLVVINQIKSDFWEELPAGVELEFYLFSLVKEGQNVPQEYHLYYDQGLTAEETNEYDYCTKLLLS